MKVVMYRDRAGDWRWRVHDARNGLILAESSEGYEKLGHCRAMAEKVIGSTLTVEYEVTGDRTEDDEG